MSPAASSLSATPAAARQRLLDTLKGLQAALQQLFVQHEKLGSGKRALKPLFLGLELLCKLEEQVLMAALLESKASNGRIVERAQHEIEILRELRDLIGDSRGRRRAALLGVLAGVSHLHFLQFTEHLADTEPEAMPWDMLQRETQDLLDRWHTEVLQHGEVEDEERDPVGLPPR